MACQLRTASGRRARVALVHEWFDAYYGSERVVAQILNCFPEAELFALVDVMAPEQRGFLGGRKVQTSFLQRLPFARRHFRNYLPLMPLAIEQFDLSGYDLVLSSSHAFAKGVLTGSEPAARRLRPRADALRLGVSAPVPAPERARARPARRAGARRAALPAPVGCPDRQPGRPLHRQLGVRRPPDRQDLPAAERGRASAGRGRALRAPDRQGGLLSRGLALRALQAHRDHRRGVPRAARAPAGGDRRRPGARARARPGDPERDPARLPELRGAAPPHGAAPRR